MGRKKTWKVRESVVNRRLLLLEIAQGKTVENLWGMTTVKQHERSDSEARTVKK